MQAEGEYITDEGQRERIIREHCDWIARHGSLTAAISERCEFKDSPIQRWLENGSRNRRWSFKR